ncbi:MAG TPA: S4 domain-containing protein [Candidatus Binatia bacterium]|nr:S4 domain-containing protein [Candidatus Binatia bacterium]
MSNSEYLKRLNAPRSWLIDRKIRTFITKPNPGAHPLDRALPLGFVLQHLGLAKTNREVKKILLAKHILVDGKRVKDHRLPVGLFDTVEIPDTKQHFRVGLDTKGRLTLSPADKDLKHKPCRIIGKTMRQKGKLQVNLVDSRNINADKATYKVGDTLVLELPGQKVAKHLELKPGAKILITAGRYVGKTAHVSNLEGNTVKFTIDNIASETEKENTYVIP